MSEIPSPNHPGRRDDARARRHAASDLAFSRPHPMHAANGDECLKDGEQEKKYPLNFTKGLPHDPHTGLVSRPEDYVQFVKAIFSGDRRDFRETPLGHPETKGDVPQHTTCHAGDCGDDLLTKRQAGIDRLRKRLQDAGITGDADQLKKLSEPIKLRAWESQSAGLAFDLEGPDAQAVTMPPAPGLTNAKAELTAEIAEVYAQALLRDVPFEYFAEDARPPKQMAGKINAVFAALNTLQNNTNGFGKRILEYPAEDEGGNETAAAEHSHQARLYRYLPKALAQQTGTLNPGNMFRGVTRGDLTGPYLSQFLLIGNQGVNSSDRVSSPEDGRVTYGALQVPQQVRYAQPGVDFMTTWEEWYSVQCAADVSKLELYADQVQESCAPGFRVPATPRDLATYVHYDALYEAYLNACLYLLGAGVKFDPGIPFQEGDDRDHQQGFAHFGGPHILSLVTEVATRALKCVRFQKFNVHRRLRPEALAARLEKSCDLDIPELSYVHDQLEECGLLALVRDHNRHNNGSTAEENLLLPMAFTEGSPMHPTYGAGHATVAGACVTVLKAFFDGSDTFGKAYVPTISDQQTGESCLRQVPCDQLPAGGLTVEGELNKLAANIAIGRDWAGVHYYSDYLESLRMGEEIALGILEEQKLMFNERFHMSFISFDGIPISI